MARPPSAAERALHALCSPPALWQRRFVRPRTGQDPNNCLCGWQRCAAHACDERTFEKHFTNLARALRALLLLSQAGQHSARVFILLLAHDDVAIPSP